LGEKEAGIGHQCKETMIQAPTPRRRSNRRKQRFAKRSLSTDAPPMRVGGFYCLRIGLMGYAFVVLARDIFRRKQLVLTAQHENAALHLSNYRR
jgi:hypothetical protein